MEFYFHSLVEEVKIFLWVCVIIFVQRTLYYIYLYFKYRMKSVVYYKINNFAHSVPYTNDDFIADVKFRYFN